MRALLTASFRQALEQTHPAHLTAQHLPQEAPALIVSVGKAAMSMLAAARERFPEAPFIAVPKAEAGRAWPQAERGQIIPARHPVPDEQSVRAAQIILQAVSRLQASDLLLVLVSGGGSALLCAPWGIDLPTKQALTQALLRSGADIQEINAVRKHLSAIKGGRLAAATPARIQALYLSDVPGDDLSVIASGPTVPDETTFAQALAVLDKYGLDFLEVRSHLEQGAKGALPESPKPGEALFQRVENRLIGSNQILLEAAQRFWQAQGYPAVILSDRFQGEARELARFHANLVQSIRAHGQPFRPPVVLLSGGEASVTVRGSGQGGRNQEFLGWLGFYLGQDGVWALAADSDGIDGNTSAAGAILEPDTWSQAQRLGLDLKALLHDNNAHGFFQALGGLLITGETAHNLNDFRVLVVE
ncbi:glycerate kinase [Meiothermus ruber]|jgi:hydroxypyruvate reductase|uniref:glycerate kinase type-2 family protein n=1 Tax=Meiothermus ruber TaxID=277 RepID=UPI000344DFAF|nr:glycerate kinase [Meiothermus ruber]MCL6529285.1 glycerate kinase [Meiothermus ruber]GAO76428.1 hydroxypyruvate reductase [Meiothermus ruber H328]